MKFTTLEEFKSSETDKRPESKEKKRNSYEEICREDPFCNKEMERQKRYEEIQELKEQHRLKNLANGCRPCSSS